jgi:chemotaxis protein methyltransferase CheR
MTDSSAPAKPLVRPLAGLSSTPATTAPHLPASNPSAANIGPSAAAKPISANSPFAPRPAAPPRPPISLTSAIRPALTPDPSGAGAATPASATLAAGSTTAGNRPSLTLAQFTYFEKLIYELSGMRFEANKSYFLASKIELRVQALGLKDFDAYMAYLQSPQGRPEYGPLVDEISINETFFYRHEPQLQAFRDNLLLPLVQARRTQGKKTMRIWSAASSTGDELYTLALMLRDAGLWSKDMTFELIGTDICHDALEKARAGLYRKYNIRNIPPSLLQAHFKHDNATGSETWQLSHDLRSSCRFQEGNLMDSVRCAALGKFDFIFCRNVLIYFDEPSKEKAVQYLANNLHDDGYVLLGHSENIYSQRHILRPVKEFAAAIAYQKAPPGTRKL